MKKFLSLTLSAVMALSLTGCGTAENTSVNSTDNTPSAVESSAVNDIYNLYDYENDKVFYVDKLDLNDQLSAVCTTYEFSFLSERVSSHNSLASVFFITGADIIITVHWTMNMFHWYVLIQVVQSLPVR